MPDHLEADSPEFAETYATVPIVQTIDRPDPSETRREIVIDLAGRILAKLRAAGGSEYVPTVRLRLWEDAERASQERPSIEDHNRALETLVEDGRISVQHVEGIGRVARLRER